MESREEPTEVVAKPVAKADDSFCERRKMGLEFSCIALWPGQLENHCNGCIEYAKQKVIEKYQSKQ